MKLRKTIIYAGFIAAALGLAACSKKLVPAETTAEATAAPAPETTAEEESEDYELFQDPAFARDYAGRYSTEEGEYGPVIEFKETTKNQYDVNLCIFRLCNMDGEGNWVDGAVEVAFTDPNGKRSIFGIFFPEDDDAFTLRITQSGWDLIKEQTDFTGFKLENEVPKDVIDPLPAPFAAGEPLKDGGYDAGFNPDGLKKTGSGLELDVDLYSVNYYDGEMISKLAKGDLIRINNEVITVDSVENNSKCVMINGSLDEGGVELVPTPEGSNYMVRSFDDVTSYSYIDSRTLPLSKDCVLRDSYDIEKGEKVVQADELIDYIDSLEDWNKDFFICMNTSIVVKDEKITDIYRVYMP